MSSSDVAFAGGAVFTPGRRISLALEDTALEDADELRRFVTAFDRGEETALVFAEARAALERTLTAADTCADPQKAIKNAAIQLAMMVRIRQFYAILRISNKDQTAIRKTCKQKRGAEAPPRALDTRVPRECSDQLRSLPRWRETIAPSCVFVYTPKVRGRLPWFCREQQMCVCVPHRLGADGGWIPARGNLGRWSAARGREDEGWLIAEKKAPSMEFLPPPLISAASASC